MSFFAKEASYLALPTKAEALDEFFDVNE